MSDLAGIEEIGHAAAALRIDGPETGNGEREPDALERQLEEGMGDGTTVRISGPNGTVGEEAIHAAVAGALADSDVEPELFDSSVYVEAVSFDGQAADEIVVAFSGQIKYPAADLEGRKLFDGLTLGREVELRVAGVVAGKTGSYTVSAREEEKVTGKAQVKVDTVYLLSPEELAD